MDLAVLQPNKKAESGMKEPQRLTLNAGGKYELAAQSKRDVQQVLVQKCAREARLAAEARKLARIIEQAKAAFYWYIERMRLSNVPACGALTAASEVS
jgi:hypothetical protein